MTCKNLSAAGLVIPPENVATRPLYSNIISESVNLPSTSTDASAADDHVTPKHIQPYRKAADRTDKLQYVMENQNFLTNTPVKSTD